MARMARRAYLGWMPWVGVLALGALLAGCGQAGAGNSTPQQVAAADTATPLPTATATPEPPKSGTFMCPVTASGSQNVFFDAATGLRFSYPAAWTESKCQRGVDPDGTQGLLIGNIFSVDVVPRNGQSIQQWVDAQTDTKNEVITLNPLTVAHADSAVTVSAQRAPNTDPTLEWDKEPFAQSFAIVAGSQHFYIVYGLVAQMSMSDTMTGMSLQQLAQQVVSTFDVP